MVLRYFNNIISHVLQAIMHRIPYLCITVCLHECKVPFRSYCVSPYTVLSIMPYAI